MAAFTCVVQSLKFLRRKPDGLFPFPVTFSECLFQVKLLDSDAKILALFNCF